MATIFKLIIEDDEGKTTVYPLAEGDISIGRREGNTIRLMERNVSRRHARLLRSNGAIYIEDLDSYNGIRINGERISGRYEVKEGDLVEIGDYHLALQRQEMEDVVEEEAPTQKPEGWPAVGTVPDFRLPEEILADGAPADPQVSTRDTIVDQPAPPDLPAAMPTVSDGNHSTPPHKDPAKHQAPQLPPFPTPGGPPPARVPFFSGAAAPAVKADEQAAKALAVGPSRVAAVPRLICVSTNYAGREFALTRPELIIGRVEDNDIVIEHRSVSRNHAKILFDGRTHKIIDLQSANGILVNGEEYAMTDLRKGDLIELGHVRFRFVPAGEEFAPNDEEAREMREAGIEPPAPGQAAPMKAVDVPSEVGAYDPSTAATVTDTPLSALNMNEVFAPKVEVTKPNPAPRRRESHPPKNGAAPKRATEDERPTEINHVSSRAPAAASPTAPMGAVPIAADMESEYTKPQAAISIGDDYSAASRAKPLAVLVGTVIVLGVLAAVGIFYLGSGDDTTDLHLKSLYEKKQYQEAVQFCRSRPNFANPEESWRLCGTIEGLLLKQQSKAAAEAEKLAAAEARPEEVEALDPEPEKEPEVVEAVEAEAPEQPAKVRRATVPRRPKRPVDQSARARPFFTKGKKALLVGDLSEAKEALVECSEKAPRFADCHRLLGVLYAQLDDTAASVRHYRRYVALKPNAPDANRVRKMIREVELQAGGETESSP